MSTLTQREELLAWLERLSDAKARTLLRHLTAIEALLSSPEPLGVDLDEIDRVMHELDLEGLEARVAKCAKLLDEIDLSWYLYFPEGWVSGNRTVEYFIGGNRLKGLAALIPRAQVQSGPLLSDKERVAWGLVLPDELIGLFNNPGRAGTFLARIWQNVISERFDRNSGRATSC